MFQDFPYKQFLAVRFWPTWFGLALIKALSCLSLPLLAGLGNVIGVIAFVIMPSRRRIAYKNIQVCFPEFSARQCQSINFRHFCLCGQTLISMPVNMMISRRRFERRIEITHRKAYDTAIANNENIILLAPHFMAVDAGGGALSTECFIISMYQYAKNALVDEVVRRGRLRFGGVLLERKSPLRKIIRGIREGKPFYYLPDQDAGRKGVFVPFFHQLASTTPALAKFAKATNALVIPCQTIIKPWGRGYEVRLDKPLSDYPCDDEIKNARAMNCAVEVMVRRAPEQYFWMHKRFKTQPDKEKGWFYR